MHFCTVDKIYGAVCDCAEGYRLALDSRTCEPTGTGIYSPLLHAIMTLSFICIVTGTYNVFQPLSFSHIAQYDLSSAVVYFEYHLRSRNLIACFSRGLGWFVD